MAILTRRGTLAWPLLLAATVLLRPGVGASQTPSSAQEHQVKAAFLYNFAKFIEWPQARSEGPIVLGVLGNASFGRALEQAVDGKNINGRPLVVKQSARIEELTPCHILFIPSSQARETERIFKLLTGAPVVTVGETEGFARRGGVINFFLEQNKVRFEVNPDVAARAHLRISSRLLSLARIVGEDKPGGKP